MPVIKQFFSLVNILAKFNPKYSFFVRLLIILLPRAING